MVLFGEVGRHEITFKKKALISISSKNRSTIPIPIVKSVKQKGVSLHIYDIISSKEVGNFLTPKYIKGTKGGVFLYDVNRKSTLLSIDEWFQTIKQYGGAISIIVVGVICGPERKRQIEFEEGGQVAKSKGADKFIECNALTGENVEKVFETLATIMLRRKDGALSLKELFNSD